jgi:hypothetical protein
MRRWLSALGAAGALTLVLAASASAHVSITDFRLSPSCVQPGGSVNWSVTINQDHWYHVHKVDSRVLVRNAQTGVVLSQQDNGPDYVPYGTHTRSGTSAVPANAPSGDYDVTLLLGSTQGGSEWGSATRPLKVRSLAVLC